VVRPNRAPLTKKQRDAEDDRHFDGEATERDKRDRNARDDAWFAGEADLSVEDWEPEEPVEAPAFDDLDTSFGKSDAATRPRSHKPNYRRTVDPAEPVTWSPPDASGVPSSTTPLPDTLDFEEGSAVPDGYAKSTRARRGMIIGGAVTFGVTYLLAVAYGVMLIEGDHHDRFGQGASRDGSEALFVPVAGPFIAMGTMNPERGEALGLLAGGLAQAGGAAMLLAGAFARTTVLVKTDTGVLLSPTVTPSGLGVTGSF
jgi:hypothetical protein